MAAPQQPARPVYTVGTVAVNRLFMFAGFVCFLIAALIAGGVVTGPVQAWFAGGFASWSLAWCL